MSTPTQASVATNTEVDALEKGMFEMINQAPPAYDEKKGAMAIDDLKRAGLPCDKCNCNACYERRSEYERFSEHVRSSLSLSHLGHLLLPILLVYFFYLIIRNQNRVDFLMYNYNTKNL